MSDMDEVIKEFLAESSENLDQLDRDLVTLEKDPRDRQGLASIFRTIHTIKGTCGFFDFVKLGAVTHAGENLLSRLRDGSLTLNPAITSALLALVDAVRASLASIERTGREGDGDYTALIATLNRLQEGAAPVALVPAPSAPAPAPQAVEEAGEAGVPEARPGGVSEGSIRVDVGLLDKLMNLVGELVLARNQILQFTAAHKESVLLGTTQRLNLITAELQEGVMKTRMQPIGNIWNKFPRVVRDLAVACGKQVRLDLEGTDTELDRSIIEAIKDPLTHLVRNAVDHGIETPDLRRERGKPAEGHLFLRAFHEGGQVNIEIAEDGGGIDPERIKAKALERGLISREQASRMSDRELLHLIFLPGFSTAPKITAVSGRGVGMDVVKTNVERIGGTIDIQSRPGLGTTVKIKIPLTLAIIPTLIVTSGGDRYAIPQVNLLELVRLAGGSATRGIENIHGTPVYRLRDQLLPLVYLHDVLTAEAGGLPAEVCYIVVLRADDRQFGLVVEGVNDTEEIVVKPLGKPLKGIPVFAGATILGDGKVALILDVLNIAQRAGVVSEARGRALPEPVGPAPTGPDGRQTLLLFALDRERRMALPLTQVTRLEEIPLTAVEKTVGQEMVLCRGEILPLVHLSHLYPGRPHEASARTGPLHVVVCSDQDRSVGLVVERILDIVETELEVRQTGRRPGVLGSALIQQRVTDLVDVPGLLRTARGDEP